MDIKPDEYVTMALLLGCEPRPISQNSNRTPAIWRARTQAGSSVYNTSLEATCRDWLVVHGHIKEPHPWHTRKNLVIGNS